MYYCKGLGAPPGYIHGKKKLQERDDLWDLQQLCVIKVLSLMEQLDAEQSYIMKKQRNLVKIHDSLKKKSFSDLNYILLKMEELSLKDAPLEAINTYGKHRIHEK